MAAAAAALIGAACTISGSTPEPTEARNELPDWTTVEEHAVNRGKPPAVKSHAVTDDLDG
jgi:hypothetical protein